MRAGIVICSRLDSSRVHRKAMTFINGVPLLGHLLSRVLPTGIPVVLAVPVNEYSDYKAEFGFLENLTIMGGFSSDPLMRTAKVAEEMKFEVVVRITHDKMFVEPSEIRRFLDIFEHSNLDYLYSSSFIPGTGFEVIRTSALQEASRKFQNVEHISYAIHAVTTKKSDVDTHGARYPHRLLVDYPSDVRVLNEVLEKNGNNCTLDQALSYLDKHPWTAAINRMPILSVYTCAYNAAEWLEKAMGSVSAQTWFKDFEYLLIDDCSEDATPELIEKFTRSYNAQIHTLRNTKNLGLATSANLALARARGKYIVRLDADDWFARNDILEEMIGVMETGIFDVIYPDHYLGSLSKIEKGSVHHHAGGAMFNTRALNHMKFTDGLRGHDSLDLFERAKKQLRIGYLEKPAFFYTQHAKSLSKQDPAEREKIKEEIHARVTKGN